MDHLIVFKRRDTFDEFSGPLLRLRREALLSSVKPAPARTQTDDMFPSPVKAQYW
jgi:hypothetical protein